jgi:hypothetical protein
MRIALTFKHTVILRAKGWTSPAQTYGYFCLGPIWSGEPELLASQELKYKLSSGAFLHLQTSPGTADLPLPFVTGQ